MINENECLGGKIVKKNEEMEIKKEKKGCDDYEWRRMGQREDHIFRV